MVDTDIIIPKLAEEKEMSFREFLAYKNEAIVVADILSWVSKVDHLNHLRDSYILTGGYPRHIDDATSIFSDFSEKRAIMEQELFEKEYAQFEEYLRTLAMNTGNLFKADQIAKLLGISRRKVNKYTELLMKHEIIFALGPWGNHPDTETTRHVKIYWKHLSYLRAILGDMHHQWQLKFWAIENFILLELMRKLEADHSFAFYRKKSGAEITFIITNTENTLITPIEVNTRATDAISQAFRTFDEDYHERIERYMLVNNSIWWKKDIWGIPLLIIPHVAI
jgi:predicted AAA+ superfamily ATPase